MKKTFIISFVLLLILNVVAYLVLPDRVAIHFGKGGGADSFAGKEINFLIFLGFEILLFAIFFYSPALIEKTPPKWTNLPNKHYWLKEENLPVLKKKLANLMYEFGTVFFLLFILITFLMIDANQSTPPRLKEHLFFPIFIGFMVYTLYWTIKFFISFRIPKDRRERY